MPERTQLDPARRLASETQFVRILALVVGLLALMPTLLAYLTAPAGTTYLGVQYNLDDHMVYAAWMRQAMDGALLFDNRFAVDSQPGLTIHVYFLVLGWLAKLVGIPLAMTIARVALSMAFVFLLYRLCRRVCPDVYSTKLALTLATFGMGVGFLVWHTFGQAIVRPAPDFLSRLMLGRLPTDVWQPEGYVFSSMLTSSLFMASLCLIVVVLLSFLSARDSWKHVGVGAIAMAVLMNIHSYDVLLVALVMIAFLGMAAARRQITGVWLARSLIVGAGAVPPALWFVHVLRNDPVFQARAETLTFSPNFRQVVFGYMLLIALALLSLLRQPTGDDRTRGRRLFGLLMFTCILLGMFLISPQHVEGYFLSMVAWVAVMVLVLAALALMSDENPSWNLVTAWAAVGVVAPYFPALFQRKLAMGLAVPWAVLAALGAAALVRPLDRSARNLVIVLIIVAASAGSLLWGIRELQLARQNVSNTTVHAVYLSADVAEIARRLNALESRTVVVAMPGIQFPMLDQDGRPIADAFFSPYIPDVNPILSGLAGVYTFAGHWSETPEYEARRAAATSLFLVATTSERRQEILRAIRPDFIVAPVPEAFPDVPLEDLRRLGPIVYDGQQFRLIRVLPTGG